MTGRKRESQSDVFNRAFADLCQIEQRQLVRGLEQRPRILAVYAELDLAADEYHHAVAEMERRRDELAAASRRLRELVDQLDAEAGIRRVKPRRKLWPHPQAMAAVVAAVMDKP